MRNLLLILAGGAALAAAPAAQQNTGRFFRNPSEDIAAPREALSDLQVMQRLGREHGVRVEDGREVCDHPDWQRAREALGHKMLNLATFFGMILGRSEHRNDRALSAYGTFYLDDPQHVCQLIPFFAQEPDRAIREAAFKRSIDFLRVYLPRNADVEEGAPQGAAPRGLYRLDVSPYLGLLKLEDPRDQSQGLWFLGQVMHIRPDSAKAILEHTQDELRGLLLSEDEEVRRQARVFLYNADPARREPPAEDAGDEAHLTWLRNVLYDVFPPIHRVSAGLVELRPGEELDRVAEVGRPALTTVAIGETDSGKLRSGQFFRGYRVTRLPDPLHKLGIPVNAVITSVNSRPVTTGRQILEILEEALPAQRRLLVEFAHRGESRVIEYRLAP